MIIGAANSSIGAPFRGKMAEEARQCWTLMVSRWEALRSTHPKRAGKDAE
jgi:hypothetical protein